MAAKKSRRGSKYYKGDDLTKTAGDRKRGGAGFESWERKGPKRAGSR